VYIDSLILGLNLKSSGLGCHMRGLYVGCIAYVDDLLSVSAVRFSSTAKMLNICSDHADQLDIRFNY